MTMRILRPQPLFWAPLSATLLLLTAAAPDAPSINPIPPAAPAVPVAPATPVPSTPEPPTVSKLPPTVALQKVAPEDAMPILGHRVVGPGGEDIARLVDVLVDPNGQPVAAVLDFGGFMGVGSRKIAVQWNALHFEPAEATHRITLSLTPDEIKAAPEYKDPEKGAPVVVPAVNETKPGQQ
jgi:hypothetical protein